MRITNYQNSKRKLFLTLPKLWVLFLFCTSLLAIWSCQHACNFGIPCSLFIYFQQGIWEMDSKDWGWLFFSWLLTDFSLEAMLFFCQFRILKHVAQAWLLRKFNDSSVISFENQVFEDYIYDCMFWSSCDAVELTFIVCGICPLVVVDQHDQFRSNNGSICYSSVMLDKFLPLPGAEFLPFCRMVIKLACGVIFSYHPVGSDNAYS